MSDPEISPASPPAKARPMSLYVGLTALGIILLAMGVAVLRKGEAAPAPLVKGGVALSPSIGKGESGSPSAISPLGTVPHGALTLHWSRVDGVDEYQAYILDNQFRTIYRSEKVRGDSLEVPESIVKVIDAGASHFWRVAGTRADGTEATSPSVQFMIAP